VTDDLRPTGEFVTDARGDAYRISNYDRLAPFTMSVVSSSDLWMYVSSHGGLTAGRVDAAGCLFPYETDDRLHFAAGVTGPVTIVRALTAGGVVTWRPFDPHRSGGRFERNLTKSVIGDWIEFEEIDHELGLRATQRWSNTDRFGFVRSVTLAVESRRAAQSLQVLDGFLNVMPAGVPLHSQRMASNLVDAYKRSEVDEATRLGLFTLEAQISDHAEAAESLLANAVWSRGLDEHQVLLSDSQIPRFLRSGSVEAEQLALGRRGCYLVAFDCDLSESDRWTWDLVADVALDHRAVASLRALLLEHPDPGPLLDADIATGHSELLANIAAADGLHRTGDRMMDAHHCANVLFNNMRGGVFEHNYDIAISDFLAFLSTRNRHVAARHGERIAELVPTTDVGTLRSVIAASGDPDLIRLEKEYLPLHFSRRHGDPSRPWNQFRIQTKNPDGSNRIGYEGNWRDIFQNWEALAHSFPLFLDGMIAKFVNASTVDGHNPYRITSDGVDWEIPDPDDPWGNIGYWGDHQIVYLLRLLEAGEKFSPGLVAGLLDQEIFSYADAPYRIAPYSEIVRDPKETITFDDASHDEIERRVASLGTDGQLVVDATGSIRHVNFTEKMVVTALAKIANLVADGGIWMNTQRPEWNDANNALVGNGLSVVTLCYLRKYLADLGRIFESETRHFPVSAEVAQWLQDTLAGLRSTPPPASGVLDPMDRRALLDALGQAASEYRSTVYAHGFSGRTELASSTIVELVDAALGHIDRTIRVSRRDDGLYHSYNLLQLTPDGARVEHLDEMLEGQVAVIGAGILSGTEVVEVVAALFDSAVYRPDLRTFMLYPARPRPSFLEKNRIPAERVESNPLLRELVASGDDSVITRDVSGAHHFHPTCDTVPHLLAALGRLAELPEWSQLVAAHRADTMALFDDVFGHSAFTGRSGTMYKFEGLGSVYWHMVGKLLLAVQEAYQDAADGGEPPEVVADLAEAYHRIRNGSSFMRSPAEYGAFPFDPYSHSPAHLGAQQPGMTGQVKETILTRTGELGVRVEDGCIRLEPTLLQQHEFVAEPTTWQFIGVDGTARSLTLEPGSLGFTICAVPIICRLTDGGATVSAIRHDGVVVGAHGTRLDPEISRDVFGRNGTIERLEVEVPRSNVMATMAESGPPRS